MERRQWSSVLMILGQQESNLGNGLHLVGEAIVFLCGAVLSLVACVVASAICGFIVAVVLFPMIQVVQRRESKQDQVSFGDVWFGSAWMSWAAAALVMFATLLLWTIGFLSNALPRIVAWVPQAWNWLTAFITSEPLAAAVATLAAIASLVLTLRTVFSRTK